MKTPLHHAKVTLESKSMGDPQERLPPTLIDLGDGIGSAILTHGSFAFVGEMQDPAGNKRLVIATGLTGCQCGCRAPGRAFASTPSVDEARLLASQLTTFADAMEREAGQAAADLIGRVGK